MDKSKEPKAIVIFDGFCNFCSWSVLFIIRKDRKEKFNFSASQTPAGEELLLENGMGELANHSIVLIMGNTVYSKSDAVLRIARRLSGLWPIFYCLILLPRRFRDYFYDLIARNRYRFFGMRDDCFLPSEQIRARFL